MAEKDDSKVKGFSFRVSDDLYDRVKEAARAAEMTTSEWLVEACENQFAHGTTGVHHSEREALIRMLLYDEGVMDLLYQKIAEKLRLSDIRAELADFAVHGWSAPDQNLQMRELASRTYRLISDPYHRYELYYKEWVTCSLAWEEDWTLDEYLAKNDKELSGYEIFHMECRDWNNSDRGEGICIWSNLDHKKIRKEFNKNFFVKDECVHVLAGKISASDAECKGKGDFIQSIVQLVRYVSRDNNLGHIWEVTSSKDAKDGRNDKVSKWPESLKGANYQVVQEGAYAIGIPYEFRFCWVSDDKSSGKYTDKEREKNDKSIRPEIEVRWHYTAFEEKNPAIGETPFTRQAVPENIKYGEYKDEFGGEKKRWVPVDFVMDEDDGRNDRPGYPKTGKKEVKK